MTWSGSSGTAMPQPRARVRERDTLKSSSPPATKPSASLRRAAGSMRSFAAADQLVQPLLVAGEPEEPVLLGDQLRLDVVVWAAAAAKLHLGVELLAADAVQPLVVLAVEVAGGGARPPQPLDPGAVARVAAGADEVVERQRQRPAQRPERLGGAVD